MPDTSSIDNTITNNIFTNNAGRITAATLSAVLLAIVTWVNVNFAEISAIDPRAFGAKCDGSTQDQTSMQNALNAAETAGTSLLIPGHCVVSGLSVTAPVEFKGNGSGSQIILASGSNAPAVSIAIPSTAPNITSTWANVSFRDLDITSPNRGDTTGSNQHGIAATNGSPSTVTAITLTNVNISGVPGDGIYATAFSGYFKLIGSKILLPGQNGFYCNSSTDPVLEGGEFYGAVQYNWVLSSCTNAKISDSNEFNAGLDGVLVYHSTDVVLNNDTIDTSGQHALDIQNQSGQVLTVFGGLIRWSGSSANDVTAASPVSNGTSGVNGTAVYSISGGTCTTQPTANVTWTAGVMTVNSIATPGVCSVIPTSPATLAYVSGTASGWTGATVNVTQGGLYYDVYSNATNAGITNIFGAHFQTPASSTYANKPAGNVGFYSSGVAPVNCFDCVFDLGPIGTAGITNSVTGQLFSGTTQNFTVNSSAQYTAVSGFNGTNFMWKLFCAASGCDDGVLQLLNGGVVGAQISAYGTSLLPSLSTSAVRSGFATNTDLTGRVMLSGGAYTYTLVGTYSSAPNCVTQDVTTPANSSYAVESATQVVFHGTGTDVIKYHCFGLN